MTRSFETPENLDTKPTATLGTGQHRPHPSDGENTPLRDAIRQMPKAELHVHIEGTLEPELIFELAERNHVFLPYKDVATLRDAYQFTNLQSFLDLYYAGAKVLRTERDYFDMTWAYMQRAHADGIVHAEIMFDPQTHTARNVAIEEVFSGIDAALTLAEQQMGITSRLILCFLRHLPEQDAFDTLACALPLHNIYRDRWVAIGLDSAEKDNPPQNFARVFRRCKELGFRLVAHAGEEGPADYVRDALDILGAQRIDHGVRSEDDPALMQRIIDEQIPLTVCPLSNLKLGVVKSLDQHNVARLLRRGALVTINSDDPSYFGGYLVDNYLVCATELGMTLDELKTLANNSIRASFLSDADKRRLLHTGT